MRRVLSSFFLATILLPGSALGQADGGADGEKEKKEEKIEIAPTAKVTCSVLGSKKFSATLSGASESILSIEVRDCRFRTNLAGVSSVRAEFLVDLSENADYQFCQSIQIAQLFELRSAAEDFAWPAHRVVVNELALENLSEDVKELSLIRIHDKLSGSAVSLNSVLSGGALKPTYDDLFWGDVLVFEEPEGGSFSRLLKEKLPSAGKEQGKPDYELKLSLEVFPARGLCLYQVEVTENGEKIIRTLSKPLTFTAEKAK